MNTSTTLDDIWADDVLERRAEAEVLIRFLRARSEEHRGSGRNDCYVIALNASWGQGKTFFLERLRRHLEVEGLLSTYVNGWRDDAVGEPLIAVMAAIEESLRPYLSESAQLETLWRSVKIAGGQALAALAVGAVKRLAQKVVGEGLDDAAAILGEAQPASSTKSDYDPDVADAVEPFASLVSSYLTTKIDEYANRLRSVEEFKRRMSAVLKELHRSGQRELPLFVLIDELDRCRPSYSIETLEQIKHLFDIDGVSFVVATDMEQLSHAVNAVYGAQFNSTRYLLRFFNRQYIFREPPTKRFVEALLLSHPLDVNKISCANNAPFPEFFAGAVDAYGLSLRDAEQCYDLLRTVCTLWDLPVPVQLTIMLPLIIARQQGREADLITLAGPSDIKPDSPIPSKWTYPQWRVDEGRGRILKHQAVLDARNRINRLVQNTLPKIMESDNGSDWVHEAFSREFQRVHGGRYNTSQPPYSVIREYPRIVGEVSRFTQAPGD